VEKFDSTFNTFDALDHMPLGVCVVSGDGMVLFWNRCLEDWTKIERSDLLGKEISERFPHLKEPPYQRLLQAVFSGGPFEKFSSKLHEYIFPSQLPNGHPRPLATTVTGLPMKDNAGHHAMFIVQDVTEQTRLLDEIKGLRNQALEDARKLEIMEKEHQKADQVHQDTNRQLVEAIERSNQMAFETEISAIELSQIFNATADGMCVIDREFNVLRINDTLLSLMGIDRSKIDNKKCYDLFGYDYCKDSRCPLKMVLDGQNRVEYDIEIECHGGERIPCILTATTFRNFDGSTIGIIINVKNIAERKRAEEDRIQREKLQGVLEMAGAVCHELNQPLQSITGYCSLLLINISDTDPIHQNARSIEAQIDKIAGITQKLMSITTYKTKDYPEGKIVDIDKASEK
jgi:PAS domain S-box-containing protein